MRPLGAVRWCRTDLCAEAIRLGRLVRTLDGAAAPRGSHGARSRSMLLHDARRDARLDEAGDLVLLEEQDRSRWNQQQIAEALPLVEEALRGGGRPVRASGGDRAPCTARRRAPKTRTGPQIVRLYDLLERVQPSPIVSLNRAVAVAMAEGPRAALALDRCARRVERSRRAITCCTPRAPICCAVWVPAKKPRKATGGARPGQKRKRAPISGAPPARSAVPARCKLGCQFYSAKAGVEERGIRRAGRAKPENRSSCPGR